MHDCLCHIDRTAAMDFNTAPFARDPNDQMKSHAGR